MRQLIIKVPEGNKQQVEDAAEKFNGKNTIVFPSEAKEVFILHLPNNSLNDFLEELDSIEEMEINLIPRGVINLYPPRSKAPEEVADVHRKSSFEIYLGGIQSVGSIFGLVGYSIAAGILVWIGLYTTTVYLLVAAMLIAPFAGPAMNAALASSAGKFSLLISSLGRYGLAMVAGAVASFILTAAAGLQILTPLMVEVSHVSGLALVLPIVAGFAGALNICRSERDSLISGAAVGILVAASLAPPVGLLGVGFYLMDSDVILSSIFRILLQLLGIHLAATAVFYFYGKVSRKGIRFLKGSRTTSALSVSVVIIGIVGMLFWQFSDPPFLRKASMNTILTEELKNELKKMEDIQPLTTNVTFSSEERDDKPVVIFHSRILPKNPLKDSVVHARVMNHLKENLRFPEKEVYEVYQVDVVEE